MSNDPIDLRKVISFVRGLSLGEDTTTLIEQRDNSIKKLSEFLDINTFEMDGGALGITTGRGQVLLDHLDRERFWPIIRADQGI